MVSFLVVSYLAFYALGVLGIVLERGKMMELGRDVWYPKGNERFI